MKDINNQLINLEKSISISNSGYKKTIIYSLLGGIIPFVLFRPIYMYNKNIEKKLMEKNNKKVNVYVEKYKISYKRIIMMYILYVIIAYLILKYVYKL
jgi:hypothetical protein